jgi:hypothetical protein
MKSRTAMEAMRSRRKGTVGTTARAGRRLLATT